MSSILAPPVAAQPYHTWRLVNVVEQNTQGGYSVPDSSAWVVDIHADSTGGEITIGKRTLRTDNICNEFVNFYTYKWVFNPPDVSVVYGSKGDTLLTIHPEMIQKYQDPNNCIPDNFCIVVQQLWDNIGWPDAGWGGAIGYGLPPVPKILEWCTQPRPDGEALPPWETVYDDNQQYGGFTISTGSVPGLPKEGGFEYAYDYLYKADDTTPTETQAGSTGGGAIGGGTGAGSTGGGTTGSGGGGVPPVSVTTASTPFIPAGPNSGCTIIGTWDLGNGITINARPDGSAEKLYNGVQKETGTWDGFEDLWVLSWANGKTDTMTMASDCLALKGYDQANNEVIGRFIGSSYTSPTVETVTTRETPRGRDVVPTKKTPLSPVSGLVAFCGVGLLIFWKRSRQ